MAPRPPEHEHLTGWVEDKLADLLGEVTHCVRAIHQDVNAAKDVTLDPRTWWAR